MRALKLDVRNSVAIRDPKANSVYMTYAQNEFRVVPFPEIVRSVSLIFKQTMFNSSLSLTSGCRIKRYTFTSINISRKCVLLVLHKCEIWRVGILISRRVLTNLGIVVLIELNHIDKFMM